MNLCETCGVPYDGSGLVRDWEVGESSWECGRCLAARARRLAELGWLRSQAPWDMACPTCLAEPWHPCRGPEGGIVAAHLARVADE
jgi:hypothetical protein